jgi:hypothetical protein
MKVYLVVWNILQLGRLACSITSTNSVEFFKQQRVGAGIVVITLLSGHVSFCCDAGGEAMADGEIASRYNVDAATGCCLFVLVCWF